MDSKRWQRCHQSFEDGLLHLVGVLVEATPQALEHIDGESSSQ